ncbi:flotillin-like protein FloA [Bernardetia sp. OM2101]|uniref:flotillin-like protein FloA n=1 Tax=Bernardetia sp. OM2101 TaxID=3344876 RepID=UPI0035D01307
MSTEQIILFSILGVIVLGLAYVIRTYIPINLWITAIFSGVRLGLLELVAMRIRNVRPRKIVLPLINASKAGLKEITASDLETHFLAGGSVEEVVKALIAADKANIDLSFKQAAAIDLAGRDVSEAVQISVNPKVITTNAVTSVAQDGIQLITKARVTLRANIAQLVGGAGEETILARVGEGIVTAVGSSHSHKDVLENPDRISKLVLEKGLDAGTAFEILSIDIADIDVGENIGAKLQIEQANADLRVAEAKAEERRAMAIAVEQEMKAKAQASRAKVIEAEAEVPKALAEALRSGNFGIMDYQRLRNMQADTLMRESIAAPEEQPQKRRNDDDGGYNPPRI